MFFVLVSLYHDMRKDGGLDTLFHLFLVDMAGSVNCQTLTNKPESDPRPVRVGFVVHKLAVEQLFSKYYGFHLSVSIQQYSTNVCYLSSTDAT